MTLLLHLKNRCGSCPHFKLEHVNNRCSKCACVARPRDRNWKAKDVQYVYNEIAKGIMYHPHGIRLEEIILIVARHDKKVYDYFMIEKYGRKLIRLYNGEHGHYSNMRYYRLRKEIEAGRLDNIKVNTVIPFFTVIYDGEGFA